MCARSFGAGGAGQQAHPAEGVQAGEALGLRRAAPRGGAARAQRAQQPASARHRLCRRVGKQARHRLRTPHPAGPGRFGRIPAAGNRLEPLQPSFGVSRALPERRRSPRARCGGSSRRRRAGRSRWRGRRTGGRGTRAARGPRRSAPAVCLTALVGEAPPVVHTRVQREAVDPRPPRVRRLGLLRTCAKVSAARDLRRGRTG
jgi:hypothetical protein